MENNQNNGMVSAFGASMPAEYEQATADVISELNINIAAPVLFQYAYNLLSNYGKNYVTKEDIFTFLVQCKNLGLNPLLKQIYGFVSRGKLAIVVSIEGWNAIANRSPQFDGCSFEFGPVSVRDLQYSKTTYNNGSRSSGMVTVKRNVADWVKCIIYRKDRGHPIAVTTYFDEAFTGSEPWATMPMQMLQNRAFVNSVRKAFNVCAYSEDDQFFNMAPEPASIPAESPEPNDKLTGMVADAVIIDAVPDPVPELTTPEPASILGQVVPGFDPDVDIPELESKPKKTRKKKTAEQVPVPAASPEPEPIAEESVINAPAPAPEPESVPKPAEPASVPAEISGTAIDLANTLNTSKNITVLQQLGYMIAGMPLSPSEKNYLRTIYQNNLKRFNK